MKVKYKGFEIEAKREKALGGWEQVYFTTKRLSDGWYLTNGFSDDNDTLETHIRLLKSLVDDYIEHPEDYGDDCSLCGLPHPCECLMDGDGE